MHARHVVLVHAGDGLWRPDPNRLIVCLRGTVIYEWIQGMAHYDIINPTALSIRQSTLTVEYMMILIFKNWWPRLHWRLLNRSNSLSRQAKALSFELLWRHSTHAARTCCPPRIDVTGVNRRRLVHQKWSVAATQYRWQAGLKTKKFSHAQAPRSSSLCMSESGAVFGTNVVTGEAGLGLSHCTGFVAEIAAHQ